MAMTLIALAATATPAHAQSPAGCGGNLFDAGFLKDRSFIRDGETINYTVRAANDALNACDASTVTLRLQYPTAAGTPSPVFQNLTNRLAFSYPTPRLVFGPYPYKVNFGAAPPDRYTARLSTDADSVVHDTPAPYSPLNIDRFLQTLTVRPGLTIDKVGSTTGGPAPQNVVYTYTVKNVTLPAGLPDDVSQMQNVVPTDDLCSPMTLISGDTNGDRKMQITETWTYTCSSTFTNPGVYTNTAKVCADELADNIPKNYCSPPDTWTVTVTPPPDKRTPPDTPTTPTTPSTPVSNPPAAPAPSQGAVLGVSEAPCKLSTPRGLKVRKGEVTTVKVTVRNVDAGSVTRITLPGGKVLRAKTNAKGVATFKVKPTRTGRATIRTAECASVKRFTVRAARRTAARRIPRVTG
jgi:hypothetical protein